MAKKVSAAKAAPARTTKSPTPTAGSPTISAADAAAIVKKVIARVPKSVFRTSELDEATVRPILDLPEPDQSVCMTILAEQIGELQFRQSESFKKRTRDATWEREKAVQQITVLERLLRRRKGHTPAQIERMSTALIRGTGSWAVWGSLVPLLLQAGKDGLLTQKSLGAVSHIIKTLGNHPSASDRKRIATLTELLRTAKPHGGESEASESVCGKLVAATPDAARAAAVARGRQAFAAYRRANASHGRYSQGSLKGMKRPDLVADLSPEESVGVVLAASEEFRGVAKDGGGLNADCSKLFNFATVAVLDALYRRALPYTPAEFEALSEILAAFDYPSSLACPHFGAFVIAAEKWASQNALAEGTAAHLQTFSQALRAIGRADEARSGTRLAEVLNQKGYGAAAAQESGLLEPLLIARETLPKEAPRSFVDALSESMAVPPEGDDKSITFFTVSALGKELTPVISIINAALDCRPFHHTKRNAHEAEIQARAQTVAKHGGRRRRDVPGENQVQFRGGPRAAVSPRRGSADQYRVRRARPPRQDQRTVGHGRARRTLPRPQPLQAI
jgi:hypothetical protein